MSISGIRGSNYSSQVPAHQPESKQNDSFELSFNGEKYRCSYLPQKNCLILQPSNGIEEKVVSTIEIDHDVTWMEENLKLLYKPLFEEASINWPFRYVKDSAFPDLISGIIGDRVYAKNVLNGTDTAGGFIFRLNNEIIMFITPQNAFNLIKEKKAKIKESIEKAAADNKDNKDWKMDRRVLNAATMPLIFDIGQYEKTKNEFFNSIRQNIGSYNEKNDLPAIDFICQKKNKKTFIIKINEDIKNTTDEELKEFKEYLKNIIVDNKRGPDEQPLCGIPYSTPWNNATVAHQTSNGNKHVPVADLIFRSNLLKNFGRHVSFLIQKYWNAGMHLEPFVQTRESFGPNSLIDRDQHLQVCFTNIEALITFISDVYNIGEA